MNICGVSLRAWNKNFTNRQRRELTLLKIIKIFPCTMMIYFRSMASIHSHIRYTWKSKEWLCYSQYVIIEESLGYRNTDIKKNSRNRGWDEQLLHQLENRIEWRIIQAIVLQKKDESAIHKNLEVDGKEVKWLKGVNNFGVVIQNELTWKNHIEQAVVALNRIFQISEMKEPTDIMKIKVEKRQL